MKYFKVIALILFCANSAYLRKIVINTGLQGYYWRDLNGPVPEDAIIGGVDIHGDPLFIGLTVHYGGGGSLLTGPYIPKDRKMYYEYGGKQLTVGDRIKILCSQEPENFKWITVKYGNSVDKKNESYVPGGDDTNRPLAIGRIKVGEEIVLGKVLIVSGVFADLYYHWKGSGTSTAQYEALFYTKDTENELAKKSSVQSTNTCLVSVQYF